MTVLAPTRSSSERRRTDRWSGLDRAADVGGGSCNGGWALDIVAGSVRRCHRCLRHCTDGDSAVEAESATGCLVCSDPIDRRTSRADHRRRVRLLLTAEGRDVGLRNSFRLDADRDLSFSIHTRWAAHPRRLRCRRRPLDVDNRRHCLDCRRFRLGSRLDDVGDAGGCDDDAA
jgi:hypothetical protein